MYMRAAKGKKNEIFNLLNYSKWTEMHKQNEETSLKNFSYKHTKTSI